MYHKFSLCIYLLTLSENVSSIGVSSNMLELVIVSLSEVTTWLDIITLAGLDSLLTHTLHMTMNDYLLVSCWQKILKRRKKNMSYRHFTYSLLYKHIKLLLIICTITSTVSLCFQVSSRNDNMNRVNI